MKSLYTLLFGFLSMSIIQVSAQKIFDQEILKRHVYFLASEEMEGRGTGTKGEALAADYLAASFKALHLAPAGESNSYILPFDFKYSTKMHGAEESDLISTTGKNVAGFLDNGAEFTIVIGAHYDHLAKGELGGSRAPQLFGQIHFGADDNASGTAGVLALADYFVNNERKEAFNILFVCFSGEELGLHGSKKFVERLPVAKEKINYMLNMDMIGRMKPDSRTLVVTGMGSAKEWDSLLIANNKDFTLVKDSSGIGASDHSSFYLAGIPVLNFFTGQHSDYHTPGDTPEKINYEGQSEILTYITRIISGTEKLAKLNYMQTANKGSDTPRFKVTMGVMPDYTWQDGGLRLDGVSLDKPAANAGLKAGDIVLQIGDSTVDNIQDYMKVLGKHDKGDKVKVKIKREGKEMMFDLEF